LRNINWEFHCILSSFVEIVVDVQDACDFSLLHIIQTGSGAHLASYPMGAWGSFPRGKVEGA
jgi:hypothetical protein